MNLLDAVTTLVIFSVLHEQSLGDRLVAALITEESGDGCPAPHDLDHASAWFYRRGGLEKDYFILYCTFKSKKKEKWNWKLTLSTMPSVVVSEFNSTQLFTVEAGSLAFWSLDMMKIEEETTES